MIDIHCHILPGIDDGPSDMAESLEMSRVAALDGITRVVATPHVKDDACPPALVRERVGELNARIAEEDIPLRILPGADTDASLDPSLLRGHTINGTGYLLVEFPHVFLPRSAGEVLFRLMVEGIRPIITHPERNCTIMRDPSALLRLVETGALVQITAGSLTGGFGSEARECAFFLLERGVVSFIATDAHSSRGRRPVLSGALKAAGKVLGKERALRLVFSNPEAVLAGETVNA